MEFNLNKNAHNFINESIHCVKRAFTENDKYPFAILHLTQGLELTLKSLLLSENEMLIYDNIDKPNLNKTVGINTALNRLEKFKIIDIESSDKVRLGKIINFRNKITHFEYHLDKNQAHDYYIRLFEFVHYFYTKYLKIDLHEVILKEHWACEAELLSQIKKSEQVHYNETLVHKNYPIELVEYQKYNGVIIDNEPYYRIKYGDETIYNWKSKYCGDCLVKKGEFHTDMCDHEQCPKCGEQFIGFHKCEPTEYIKIEKPVPNSVYT